MNQDSNGPVTAGIKLTIHTNGRFFGPGIGELLERMRETGSMQAATAGKELSYSKAWGISMAAIRELQFKAGGEAYAVVKAASVMVGIDD